MIHDDHDAGPSATPSAPFGDTAGPLQSLAAIEADITHLIRALAEARFDLQSRAKAQQEQTRDLLLALLEVVDAFERVYADVDAKVDRITPQMKKWLTNFRTVWRLLEATLKERGVAAMSDPEGGFDPHRHRVAETVEDPARPEGSVVRMLSQGYLWHGELLRKAELVVVHNPARPPL